MALIDPTNPALRESLSHFSSWARSLAIIAHAEQIPPVAWSKEALAAFDDAASTSSTIAQRQLAASLAEREWRASPTRDALAEALSRSLSMTSPEADGVQTLHHPIQRQALRFVPSAYDQAPIRIGTIRSPHPLANPLANLDRAALGPDILWAPESEKDGTLAFHGSTGAAGSHLLAKKSQARALARALGPAMDLIPSSALLAADRSPATSGDFDDFGTDKQSPLRSMLDIARLLGLSLPEGHRAKAALAQALGSDDSSPHGWLSDSLAAPSLEQAAAAWSPQGAEALLALSRDALARLQAYATDPAQDPSRREKPLLVALSALLPLLAPEEHLPDGPSALRDTINEATFSSQRTDKERRPHPKARLATLSLGLRADMDWSLRFSPLSSKKAAPFSRAWATQGDEAALTIPEFAYPELSAAAKRSLIDPDNPYEALLARSAAFLAGKSRASVGDIAATRDPADEQNTQALINEAKSFLINPNGEIALAWARGTVERCLATIDASNSAKPQVSEMAAFHASALCELSESTEAIATAREAHWARSIGLSAAAKRIDEGEGAEVTLGELRREADLNSLAQAKSPAAKLWHAMDRCWRSDARIASREDARSLLGQLGLGTAELEAFCSTAHSESFIQTLSEMTQSSANNVQGQRPMLFSRACSLLCAFEHDSRHPDPRGGWANATPARRSALGQAAQTEPYGADVGADSIAKLGASALNDSEKRSAAFAAEQILGQHKGIQWALARAQAWREQAGSAMRHSFDSVMGRAPIDPAPSPRGPEHLSAGPLGESLGAHKPLSGLAWLPYGFEPDLELRYRRSPLERHAAVLSDLEVDALLEGEGLAAELARLACRAGRAPDIRQGADARSRANAWLGAGKAAAKEWLGVGDAAWKLACSFSDSNILKTGSELSDTARAAAAQEASILDPAAIKKIENSACISWMLSQAAMRKSSPESVDLAWQMSQHWRAECDKAAKPSMWGEGAFSTMREGASHAMALQELLAEAKRFPDTSQKIESAILDRATELHSSWIAAHAASPATEKAAKARLKVQSADLKAFENQISEMADWAAAMAGRFSTSVGRKPTWESLMRGSARWHADQINKVQEGQGVDWPAIGVQWSDPSLNMEAVELCTSAALAAEGKAMRHCVGSYSERCASGQSRIFSIRKDGARLATLELAPPQPPEGRLGKPEKWSQTQLRGVCNSAPTAHATMAAGAVLDSILANIEQKADARRAELKEAVAKIASAEGMEAPGFSAAEALFAHRDRKLGAATLPAPAAPLAKKKAP